MKSPNQCPRHHAFPLLHHQSLLAPNAASKGKPCCPQAVHPRAADRHKHTPCTSPALTQVPGCTPAAHQHTAALLQTECPAHVLPISLQHILNSAPPAPGQASPLTPAPSQVAPAEEHIPPSLQAAACRPSCHHSTHSRHSHHTCKCRYTSVAPPHQITPSVTAKHQPTEHRPQEHSSQGWAKAKPPRLSCTHPLTFLF